MITRGKNVQKISRHNDVSQMEKKAGENQWAVFWKRPPASFAIDQSDLEWSGNLFSSKIEFHETCHLVTFYFMKKRLQTML